MIAKTSRDIFKHLGVYTTEVGVDNSIPLKITCFRKINSRILQYLKPEKLIKVRCKD